MYVHIGDDRYFTSGTDNVILQEIELYDSDQYEREYPRISSTMPEIFCVNLQDEILRFMTTASPQFEIDIEDVIDLACYYYCDWDAVVAVTDEFVNDYVLDKVRKSLVLAQYDVKTAEDMLQDLIVMLGEALKHFIGIIIGVLSRAGVPAIMDYGSCYRMKYIDNFNNIFFQLRNPPQVYDEISGEDVPNRQHCGKY